MRRLLGVGALGMMLVPHLSEAQGAPVSLLGYHAMAPAEWTSRAASSAMRLAEFVTPSAPGAAPADVVVYFFGPGQGGSVESNIARWRSQFSMPDGSAVPQSIRRDSTPTFPVTLADFRGTYARGIGAGSPEQAKPDQSLVAAIVETPKGTLFVQMFGPTASVSAQRDALLRFVTGISP